MMKIRLAFITIVSITFSLSARAQDKVSVYETLIDSAKLCMAEQRPDVAIDCLRRAYHMAVESNAKAKVQEGIIFELKDYLSHVKILQSPGTIHNTLPKLECTYDDMLLSTKAYLKTGELIDTIRFINGVFILKDVKDTDISISLLDFKSIPKSKKLNKLYSNLLGDYEINLTEKVIRGKKNIFHVADDGLYYAAIESKKIPGFEISSNSNVINYVSCLKTVLEASGVAAAYEEIIKSYLGTSIDAKNVELKGYDGIISGRRVITSIIQGDDFNAQFMINELLKERFVIVVQKDASVGLLTAIAFDASRSNNPVHVRMRLPILPKQEQRVQFSWTDFMRRTTALVKVDIY